MAQNLYEGMFLIDGAKAGGDFPAVIQHIAKLLEQNGAQIERIEKWAESRLAYAIKQVERGVYVLVYFRAEPDRIAELRHDVRLSEEILRMLILRAGEIPEPKGKLFSPQGEPVQPVQKEPEPQPAPAGATEPESDASEAKDQSEPKPVN